MLKLGCKGLNKIGEARFVSCEPGMWPGLPKSS